MRCRLVGMTNHDIRSIVPALAQNARTGYPQFHKGKERPSAQGWAIRPCTNSGYFFLLNHGGIDGGGPVFLATTVSLVYLFYRYVCHCLLPVHYRCDSCQAPTLVTIQFSSGFSVGGFLLSRLMAFCHSRARIHIDAAECAATEPSEWRTRDGGID